METNDSGIKMLEFNLTGLSNQIWGKNTSDNPNSLSPGKKKNIREKYSKRGASDCKEPSDDLHERSIESSIGALLNLNPNDLQRYLGMTSDQDQSELERDIMDKGGKVQTDIQEEEPTPKVMDTEE